MFNFKKEIMKNRILITFLAVVLIMITACRDDSLAPIATFDAAEKGAYVRLVEQNNSNFNLFDLDNSLMEFTVEFVDLEKGNLVSEYNLLVEYQDNNPDNGDETRGLTEFRSWSATDFTTNKAGFQGLENIRITASEAFTALGISAENVKSGDRFIFRGNVTTTSGANYSASNSSASVNGASFRGFFNFTINAFCPSSLEGEYTYQTIASSINCPLEEMEVPNDLTGTVSIIALGGGEYTLSDWSFGAYAVCYEPTDKAAYGKLQFTETCKEVAFTGKIDDLGEKWSFVSDIDGQNWTITWENTFGEQGSATIENPNGWDFSLAEE